MNEFNLKKVFKWQQASKPIVKKYVADLYQTGTDAPVVTELYNDTDVAFTCERVFTGVYAIKSSKPLFTNITGQKVQVTIGNPSFQDISITAFPGYADTIIILTSNGLMLQDGLLGQNAQNAVEITIYP